MIEWLISTIPIIKGVHIAALVIWCCGLLALPLMLGRHHPETTVDEYSQIRRATHITYTLCVTPAAVLTVIAGTWLIFLREAFVPWLFAKLAFVALLVVAHAWIGHILARGGEDPTHHQPPKAIYPVTAALLSMLVILTLVLAKPAFDWVVFPDWLLEPRGGHLPFDVPNR
jgi:uncharacterized membrane protein